ncbi:MULTISPECIES: DUF6460 domain-containing protein [Bartonella]|uniref:DUF6460 domain-containing protein n=4 Tax=Bartonella TaxID=773 RepID=E6Z0G5_BARSR|nr:MULTISPECIES: DUF6460 domain-containing protein [Bartonella]AQX31074.1 hypothetical protein BscR1v2_011500 [Bartonella schoenbuchensis R1]ENN90982.1 hypothetical protein m07a_09850 [Bartonella schoenbuchensis m07a]MBA9083202.1 hypothetical protein [Bartonella chomelii]CBI82603.1 conserved hypothetical protein [Bartonella schoenbuchensis R1]CDP80485.1 hypothetical protein BN1046_01420 [Bartonella schoenbuchensis]
MKNRKKSHNSLHSFLGGTPGRIAVKLLILSFFTGIAINILGWTPIDLIWEIIDFLQSLWETGFMTFVNLFHVTLAGAVIVMPVFLFLRIFRRK